jgi:hypothetical protein
MAGRPKRRAREGRPAGRDASREAERQAAAERALERDDRVLLAAEMLLAGGDDDSIIRHARKKEWPDDDRLIPDARERVLQAAGGDRDTVLREHIAKRRMLYRRALRDGDTRTAAALLRDEGELLGLYQRKGDGVPVPARALPAWMLPEAPAAKPGET